MTAIPRRRTPYLDVYNYDYNEETPGQAAGPSHLSAATSRPKRYSAISSKSALTADTPSTPPRTPSPVGYRHLAVPVTALPGVRMDEEGAKERESRSLRRARSAERTRTWAEEVERQRMKVERKAERGERASEHRWVNDDASEIWTASSEAIHAIVDELNPESSHLSHLPSADRVIANISRKAIKLSSSPSESDASGEAYFGSQRHKAAMKRATAKKTDKKAEEKKPEARRTSKDRATKDADPQPVQVVFPGPAPPDRRSRSRKEQSHTTSVEPQQATSAARPATRSRSSTSPQSVVAQLPAPPTPPITAVKPKVALLSIDDIVKKHSSAVNGALNAVTEKARKDLGTTPRTSPAVSPVPTLPSPGPVPPPRSSSRSIRSVRSPPPRMSSLPVSPAHSPPARNSSLPVQPLLSGRQTFSASTGARLSVNPDHRTRPRASTLFPSSDEELSNDDVMNDILAGQALLDRLETGSIASSRKRLDSRAHSSTPPPDRYSSPTPSSTRSKRQSLPAQRKEEEDHVMAVYLRSSRLNRIIQLPRAYPERPLQVSLADLGSPTGTPVLVFLGIGCVRHLIALFDDLAKALNIRLICIDRWGFGKTTNVAQDKRAPMDWAGVVERVLDEIKVDGVRIIAHSAGAPYAAATALRLGDRVKGKIQFLAPWISADIDGGYKWLKWVPNGVIKSAFAAEWKLQSYRLGKPPPLNHKPISHVAEYADVPSRPASARINSDQTVRNSPTPTGSPYLSRTPSLAKRASQILIGRSDNPASSAVTLATPQNVSSLRKVRSNAPVRSHSDQSVPSKPSFGTGAQTPSGSASSGLSSTYLRTPGIVDQRDPEVAELDHERFVADLGMALPSPSLSSIAEKPPTDASLLHALEQASHAECEPGTTDDLLTIILNRPARSWGFSYADLTQPATIWWGSEDERISEKSVRWMERVIVGGADLKVVQGADHNLMRSVPVMCEIFQEIADEARREA